MINIDQNWCHGNEPILGYYKLKFKTEGVVDDGLDIVELGWEESSELKFLAVDWNKDVEDDINLRSRFILTFTDDWLQRKNKRIINEPSVEVISFPQSLQFDTLLSLVAGSILVPDK